jgi:hypothetical protein
MKLNIEKHIGRERWIEKNKKDDAFFKLIFAIDNNFNFF